jgi:hypothetical protein
VLFGLVPALQLSKPDLTDAVKASRSTGAGVQGGRTRDLLVVVEVALSVVLLVSAGLTVRTFLVLQQTDTGMQAGQVLMMGVPLPPRKYTTLEQRNLFTQQPSSARAAGRRRGNRRRAARRASEHLPDRGPGRPMAPATTYLVGPDHLRTSGRAAGGRMFDASEVSWRSCRARQRDGGEAVAGGEN